MNVNTNLKNAVATLTAMWPHCGTVRVMSWDDYVKAEHTPGAQFGETYAEFLKSRNIHFQPAPDCIVVDYDFSDDELDATEREKFSNDLDLLWNGMREQGKPLYDFDGSGGGLYYGMNIYPAAK